MLKVDAKIARTTVAEVTASLMFQLNDGNKGISFGVSQGSPDGVLKKYLSAGTSRVEFDKKYLGTEQSMELSFNKLKNDITITYAGIKRTTSNSFVGKTVSIIATGSMAYGVKTAKPEEEPSDYTRNKVIMSFKSFEYTDYYMKATNSITDYANRPINGAVGSGHVIGVHPTVLNNSNADTANTQRFSGNVSIDKNSMENIVPQDDSDGNNIADAPLEFIHDGNSEKNTDFKAKIDTGNKAYTSGQKFRLPMLVNDNYFGKTDNFTDATGAAAEWSNLKDELPLRLSVIRNTYRELTSDLSQAATPTSLDSDYTHTINGEAAAPNDHGWYNKDVTINFLTNAAEFNELNFSKTDGGKIPGEDIKYQAVSGGTAEDASFVVKGSNPSTGESTASGDTYHVFARKGGDDETEYLSAVTTETFRIDKEAPTLAFDTVDSNSGRRRLKAADNLSGIDYIKWKGPKDTEFPDDTDHRIQIESDPRATQGSTAPTAQQLPAFTDLGSYQFIAVDLAGNESEVLTATNTIPTLEAQNITIKFGKTLPSFTPASAHKTKAEDTEDGKYEASRIKWKIEREGHKTITGDGDQTLPDGEYLPVGTYNVIFWLDGNGGDSDANKPDPEKVTVKLTVTPEGPPDITLSKEPDAGIIDGTNSTRPDGSRHYMVEDEKTIIADKEEPYSGGTLTEDEIKSEIEEHFNFKSKIPYPANQLEIDLKIYDDKGNDVTGIPINTLKNGSYTAVYVATDVSGCTTTLQLTYVIKENVTVTFHPGKGDYKDGSEARKSEIKVNKAPGNDIIPNGRTEITPPAETCFIGWGTSLNAKTTVDPAAVKLSKDTIYYAIFAPDTNENGIPDSEEAIFIFKSADPEHAAYKYADKTTVGILAPAGTAVTLPADKIPDLLFDRTDDTGYRLMGWKTDATGDDLLTTEQLCALGRNEGTKLTVTAMITTYPIEAPDKVKVTFFSSDPENAPLEGGEGQTIYINAPKEGEPVYLSENQLPAVKLSKGSQLEGWKMEKTGDQLMEAPEVTGQDLYPGETVAVVAYVKAPPKKEIIDKEVVKEKPVKVTEKKEKTVTKKAKNSTKTNLKKTAKEEEPETVTFAFFTSNDKHGTIKKGDGTSITKNVSASGTASLKVSEIPAVTLREDCRLIGWKTSLTGSRLLSTEELCELNVPAGITVVCTAGFAYEDINVSGVGADGSLTSIIGDEKVPLGSGPSGMKNGQNNIKNCHVHWFMLLWLLLSAASILYRLRLRRKGINCLIVGDGQTYEEFISYENYAETADSQTTALSDYIFAAANLAVGAIMYIMGACLLELPILIAGALLILLFVGRMKYQDGRIKNLKEEARQALTGEE